MGNALPGVLSKEPVACRGNFNAGPAVLPAAVLLQMRDELLDYQGSGLSVLEMSHRSEAFADIAARAEQDLRALLNIPDDYAVMFMQGGASAQFVLSVMNLAAEGTVAFLDTGSWSRKAIAAARGLAPTVVAAERRRDESGRWVIPPVSQWSVPEDAAYIHVCDNETIDGVALDDGSLDALQTLHSGLPLIADFSSSILSRPIDVSRYALIYAGAQKNIGPAGLTLVIASPEVIARSRASGDLPGVFSYASMSRAGSMLNTPPTFAWYSAGLVFNWLRKRGGLPEIERDNRAQAARVYAAIDELAPFRNDVHPSFRSITNVPFTLESDAWTREFLTRSVEAGLVGLKGHKSVGGCRASLYNALPDSAVDALIDTMETYAAEREPKPAGQATGRSV